LRSENYNEYIMDIIHVNQDSFKESEVGLLHI